MKAVQVIVSGKVQGVSFRASTKVVADQMGIKGIVRNLPDGTVFIEAEGDDFTMDFFTDWCKSGPDGAEVEDVEIKDIEIKNYSNFAVLKK
ncbi:acylphosphatase [Pseudopedobacter saltans DSM 12145]|uniref:acylphosphatase n=1 Tax=Pseudopedobacter saltans (strain ATCC 51119 / DSM 12145 / JCM 21818 / CCUG 39354 / LMG 10337 / NBRC 100064 / NCIMB 13643) TaxID=762903 RepID=F0SBV9_PSESL|nr:acylphosphatase [Pseudopedobacter saltans]ADY53800.1 acylphosphatase [Pseudopedobacter saltans DSM 12145]